MPCYHSVVQRKCINYTGKFHQQSITGCFDDAAPVFGDFRVDNLRPDLP